MNSDRTGSVLHNPCEHGNYIDRAMKLIRDWILFQISTIKVSYVCMSRQSHNLSSSIILFTVPEYIFLTFCQIHQTLVLTFYVVTSHSVNLRFRESSIYKLLWLYLTLLALCCAVEILVSEREWICWLSFTLDWIPWLDQFHLYRLYLNSKDHEHENYASTSMCKYKYL